MKKKEEIAKQLPFSAGVTRSGLLYDVKDSVMARTISRRNFLKMSALAGASIVVSPGLSRILGNDRLLAAPVDPFSFAIIADSHTMGPKNPRLKIRLEAAVREINALNPQPDFVMYMGDAVHDGSAEQFKYFSEILSHLKARIYYVPGEHDWYLDMGEYYQENLIGGTVPYSFNHKGHHIVVLNGILFNDFWTGRKLTPQQRMDISGTLNDPAPGPFRLGKDQLLWLEKDLSGVSKEIPLLVFTHPPLYHYYRPWNFWTEDAPEAHAILKPFKNVSVFHGHVHQVVQNQIENLKFFATVSTSWPHPYPESGFPPGSPKMPRSNPAKLFDGLGWSRNTSRDGDLFHQDVLWTLTPPDV
ncbi:MAG: metallophosphoesterase [Nitrospiria bacterium]